MLILTSITDFLNTCREKIYEGTREKVREQLDIPEEETLYYNGYRNKSMIFINADNCLELIDIPVRRLLWIKEYGEKEHIYVYPSFILKYCPFPMNDVERVYVEFLSENIEPFNVLNDPDELLDTSLPYEIWAKRIGSILNENDFPAKWSQLFYDTFYSLHEVQTNKGFFIQCLDMIKAFVDKLSIKHYREHHLLSFANFQLPFQ